MPGGGQLSLKAFGNQNLSINGNPQATHFYKLFRRNTHFAQENITIPLDGPNLMMMDTPITLRAKIPRYADLLTDLTLVFDLPDIYSKLMTYTSTKPNASIGVRTPSFRWIHMLGAFIIDNLSIIVGGMQIQSFPGEWLAVRASTDYDADRYAKWCNMVGETSELSAPEWGVLGKSTSYPFQRGEYPHSVADPSDNTVPIAPSIVGRQIRVPLPFWFTESWGSALPLVSLQKHEVEVQIQLKTLREIYRLMDDYFQAEPCRPRRRLQYDPSLPTQVDPLLVPSPPAGSNPPYTNLTLQANYESYVDASGDLRYFFVDPTATSTPRQNGFIMNAHLEGNYVYITPIERAQFAARAIVQLVHQVQQFSFPSIVNQQRLDMEIHGLVTRLVFFGRRTDAIESRNDYINLSNWKSLCQAPYWPLGGANPPTPNAGRLIPYAQRDIIRSVRLLCAGNEFQEEKPAPYFEVQAPFAGTKTGGVAGLNPGTAVRPDCVMGPLYQFNFALDPADHVQPTGSLNTSLIREFQIEITPWDLNPYSPYAYDFTVYAESLNQVNFQFGMGGLQFAI